MNKKIFLTSVILFLIVVNNLSAEQIHCNPTIKLVTQDPYPAIPNDYVKVLFEISQIGDCKGFAVKLNQEYPFSLDANSTEVYTIESNPYSQGYRNVWTIPYKIRIDSVALDGEYELKLQYHEGTYKDFNHDEEKGFNISIDDSRTEFDAVIQEFSGNEISIAIANIGEYIANSVVVRIPEQDFYKVSGTDGQMVGNLESGDYTIVGFTITRNFNQQNKNISRNENPEQTENPLKFDIYYTDNIGERRVVNMGLILNSDLENNSSLMGEKRKLNQPSSDSSRKIKWIVTIVIIVVAVLVYKKYPEQVKKTITEIKNKFNRKKEKKLESQIPEWVKNIKEKEKNK